MKKKIDFVAEKSHALPVCLPNGEDPRPDSTCFITGFGLSEYSDPNNKISFVSKYKILSDSNTAKTHSEYLQKAPLEIFSSDICEAGYRTVRGFHSYIANFPEKIICAGALESTQDSCRVSLES